MYIGQSIDIERRIKQHLVYCVQDNTAIHNAIKKYGADNFDWEIIEECTLNELDTKEQFWINYYNTYNIGYNETRGGQNKQHYVDYDKIKEIFLKTRNIQQTAIEVGCDRSTVSRALKTLNIDIKQIKNQQKIPISKKRILQLDNNFNTIVKSISNGRKIFLNIQNAIRFLLSGNMAGILIVLITSLFNYPIPFLAIHLLFINLLTDSFPAIAIGMQEYDNDLLNEKPRKKKSQILSKKLVIKIKLVTPFSFVE